MTYLIGAILVLLLIGLILIFRPPKSRPERDKAQQETAVLNDKPVEEQLVQGSDHRADRQVEEEEELNLDFTPSEQSDDSIEELDLVLVEEIDDGEEASRETTGATAEAAVPVAETSDVDEFDEDIPFIVSEEDGETREVEFSPALADVPEERTELDNSETPEELAERLEYFLGTGDEEVEIEELIEETGQDVPPQGEEPTTEPAASEEEVEFQEKEELTLDAYSSLLRSQEKILHQKLNRAIEEREAVQFRLFEVALEENRDKQAELQSAFQSYRSLVEEMDKALADLEQEVPEFKAETARNSLYKNEYEDLRGKINDAVDQIQGTSSLAAGICFLCGRLEEEGGEFAQAYTLYARAVGFDEENLACLDKTGRLARILGDHEQAMTVLEKRVSIGQEKGEESIELARSTHELARTLLADDQTDRAEPLLQEAAETLEKLAAEDFAVRGAVLHDLAFLYESTGRYEQSEPLYKQAIELFEQEPVENNLRLAATLNKLGGLYEEMEQEDSSEPLYFRALEIKKKVLGENHPDVGTILGHLASLLKRKGRLEEAEPMFRKSMEIAEISLGKDHPNLAMIYTDMAELYSEMGNEEQAQIFQERAFAQFGLPGMGDGFVEMSKDDDYDVSNDTDQKVTGS